MRRLGLGLGNDYLNYNTKREQHLLDDIAIIISTACLEGTKN